MQGRTLEEQVTAAKRRLETLSGEASQAGGPFRDTLERTLQELSSALEELSVAAEELKAQNDLLAAAREAAEADRRHYQELFEFAPGPYLTTDGNGLIQEANQAAARLAGVDSPASLVRHTMVGMVAPASRRDLAALMARAQSGGEGGPQELAIVTSDGEEVPIEVKTACVRSRDGRLEGIRWLLRDLREQRRMEAERHRVEHLDALGTLAGGIAHDFNNYLGGILGSLALIRRTLGESPPAEVLAELQLAERAANQAQGLAGQLLTFSRGGAPAAIPTDIGALVAQSADFILRGTQATPRFEIAPDLWPVAVDPAQFQQAITNIVLNAAQAMPGGGQVEISARNLNVKPGDPLPLEPGRYVQVTITDHGPGIPPEYRERVFDPYFTTKEGGTGLGLPITYSIVRRHRGHLAVDSREGVGTTVSMYFPAARVRLEVPAAPRPLPKAPRGGRVLFADDEYLVREPFVRLLQMTGYEVDAASSGEEAVEMYRAAREAGQPYRAVIMDLTMPGGLDGRESMKRIRDLDPDARGIVASGYSADNVMAEPERFGFRAAVPKPYTVESLLAAIEEVGRKEEEKVMAE